MLDSLVKHTLLYNIIVYPYNVLKNSKTGKVAIFYPCATFKTVKIPENMFDIAQFLDGI